MLAPLHRLEYEPPIAVALAAFEPASAAEKLARFKGDPSERLRTPTMPLLPGSRISSQSAFAVIGSG